MRILKSGPSFLSSVIGSFLVEKEKARKNGIGKASMKRYTFDKHVAATID